MEDQFDVNLEDTELLSEVELTADLVIAASEFERHLTDREIDRILQVVPRRARAGMMPLSDVISMCIRPVRPVGA